MDDRDCAVLATHVVTAMKKVEPELLTPIINELELTPWHPELVAVIRAVRCEVERQKWAKNKSKK
jgi:menaquinone-dependent protoporphyrinogen IX oxidase